MIIVDIRESDLVQLGACEEGIAFWRQIAEASKRSPKGELRLRVKWTVLHQLWASVACPSFYGWVRNQGLVPQLVMLKADLRGADLRGADLRGANLYGADLRGADLRGANLYAADLGAADLRGADLRGANLYGANLYGADLGAADLRGAFASVTPAGWVLENGVLRKAT